MRSPISCDNTSCEEVAEVYRAIYYDHAELFFITHAPRFATSFSFFGSRTSILIDYVFSSAESHRIKAKMEEIANGIISEVSGLTPIEKERFICDYMIKNVRYEINNLYNQNAGMRTWSKSCCGVMGVRLVSGAKEKALRHHLHRRGQP